VYKPVDPRVNFPKLEEEILKFWEENHIFEKSVAQRANNKEQITNNKDKNSPSLLPAT